jgi:hypothetical protein
MKELSKEELIEYSGVKHYVSDDIFKISLDSVLVDKIIRGKTKIQIKCKICNGIGTDSKCNPCTICNGKGLVVLDWLAILTGRY